MWRAGIPPQNRKLIPRQSLETRQSTNSMEESRTTQTLGRHRPSPYSGFTDHRHSESFWLDGCRLNMIFRSRESTVLEEDQFLGLQGRRCFLSTSLKIFANPWLSQVTETDEPDAWSKTPVVGGVRHRKLNTALRAGTAKSSYASDIILQEYVAWPSTMYSGHNDVTSELGWLQYTGLMLRQTRSNRLKLLPVRQHPLQSG